MNYVLADAHAPEEQYDIFFNAENPQSLEKEDTVLYVEFKDFAVCMDWLSSQDYSASILLRNGDMGLEKNDFCFYFASTAGLTSFMFTDYQIPPNLNYLYVQNLNVDHHKMRHHPLGVLTKNTGKLKRVVNENKKRSNKKSGICYINFKYETCLFRQLLPKALFADTPWVTIEKDVSQLEYYRQLSSHAFVLCPRGNGHDSYRVWETLALGSIPIVSRTVGMERLAKFLPIVIVDEWKEINTIRLEKEGSWIETNKKNWWNDLMLTQDFWTTHIKNQRSLELLTEEV